MTQGCLFNLSGEIVEHGPCQNCWEEAYTRMSLLLHGTAVYRTFHRATKSVYCLGGKSQASLNGYYCNVCKIWYAVEAERDTCQYEHAS